MVYTLTLPLASAVGHSYYTTFYLLAFSLNLALLVWEGHRLGYPIRTWLVLLACTTLSFILGTKLLALSLSYCQCARRWRCSALAAYSLAVASAS